MFSPAFIICKLFLFIVATPSFALDVVVYPPQDVENPNFVAGTLLEVNVWPGTNAAPIAAGIIEKDGSTYRETTAADFRWESNCDSRSPACPVVSMVPGSVHVVLNIPECMAKGVAYTVSYPKDPQIAPAHVLLVNAEPADCTEAERMYGNKFESKSQNKNGSGGSGSGRGGIGGGGGADDWDNDAWFGNRGSAWGNGGSGGASGSARAYDPSAPSTPVLGCNYEYRAGKAKLVCKDSELLKVKRHPMRERVGVIKVVKKVAPVKKVLRTIKARPQAELKKKKRLASQR